MLTDDHTYQSVSAISIPVVDTATGTDIDICWEALTTDIQCHEVDPANDIENVALLRFLNLSHSEVEELLVSSYLSMSDISGYLNSETSSQSTCANLSDFTLFGTEVDHEEEYVEDDSFTYMLLFTKGTTPGVGARSMLFLNPVDSETNTTVEAKSGCVEDGVDLQFNADLSSGDTLDIPMDGPWVVDWRDVTRDGGGNDIEQADVDGVMVGFYEGLSVADLEEQIFDLEYAYTNLWEVDVPTGKSADLADMKERDSGDSFAGFETDEEGTWLLALTCSTCSNPAPVLLTVLTPEDG